MLNTQIEAKEELVAVTTENVFADAFWEGLDFVTNALDNVKARLYVDSRCAPPSPGPFVNACVLRIDAAFLPLNPLHQPNLLHPTAASSTGSPCWSRARWAPSATCR